MKLLPAVTEETRGSLPFPYLHGRQEQSLYDTYRGVVMAKTPEDLRVYQHVIWETRPDVIVELGTSHGGSALWFADQLRTLVPDTGQRKLVITVDPIEVSIDDALVTQAVGRLEHVYGTVHFVIAASHSGSRVMVVDDSGHTHQTTSDALRLYHDLVTVGCYFVVEDGCVDEEWRHPSFSGSVQPAIREFLSTHPEFVGHDYRPYGFGMHPNGWLERVG